MSQLLYDCNTNCVACTGVGVDLDRNLIQRAQRNAKRVEGIRAEFIEGNFLDPQLDISKASAMYVPFKFEVEIYYNFMLHSFSRRHRYNPSSFLVSRRICVGASQVTV